MLSTFPATFPSPVGPPSPEFHPDPFPWDAFIFSHELTPNTSKPGSSDHLSVDFLTSPDNSFSGSHNQTYPISDISSPDSTTSKAVITGSGSGGDEPDRNRDEDPDKPVSTTEERKRKRKLSNRESARRSRMRKRQHLENLTSDLNRLKAKKLDLANRLRVVNHFRLITMRNNDRLMAECSFLQRRLSQMNQIRSGNFSTFKPTPWTCKANEPATNKILH